uniref:Uncharacterized protein n=1 Tax=Anguilla anguilla TaxID=7936 RepID=A0A0E9U277_ANGAN
MSMLTSSGSLQYSKMRKIIIPFTY